jgi:hypothetical protein
MRKKPKFSTGLLVVALLVGMAGCAGYWGMFRAHTYNWSTGMPSLEDQATLFLPGG